MAQLDLAIDWEISRVPAAGDLCSTARDLYSWNEALFGGRVLSPESLEAAFTVGLIEGDDPAHPEDAGYGLGWAIDRLRGQREIGHGGELPGFGSYLLRLPDHDLTVVVLLNCVPQLPGLQQWALAREIARLALDGVVRPEEGPEIDTTVSTATLDELTGRDDMGDGLILIVTRQGKRLFLKVTGRPKFEVEPRSERTFFVGEGRAEATFVRDERGRVDPEGGGTADRRRSVAGGASPTEVIAATVPSSVCRSTLTASKIPRTGRTRSRRRWPTSAPRARPSDCGAPTTGWGTCYCRPPVSICAGS